MKFAVLQIDEAAATVQTMTIGDRCEPSAARQRGPINLQHMRTCGDANEAVLSLAIGDDEAAVFQENTHARNAQLLVILLMIVIAIDIDLAHHNAAIAEHAAIDRDARGRDVRDRVAAHRLRLIDRVAQLRTGTGAGQIGQGQ